jgi:hypothetical protein
MGGYMNKLSYLFILLLFASSMHAAQMADPKAATVEGIVRNLLAQRATADVLRAKVKEILQVQPELATPLLLEIAPYPHFTVIEYLIQNGADVLTADKHGKTTEYYVKRHIIPPHVRESIRTPLEEQRKNLLELIQKQKSSTVVGVPGGAK